MAFSKILIANRGEIACRVHRTAKAMGYATVAVYSDADAGARHVALADEAVRIGPAAPAESYLNVPALLQAASLSGADAVHPGYGFLSENAEFAEACQQSGLVFIGPPPSAIRAMGNKAAAKRLMLAAGVPCVPGYQGDDQSDRKLSEEAGHLGYPIMVKAAAGGGGRGMRLVAEPSGFLRALAGARSEAKNAFGSDELILERAIVDARHVEIQVFADSDGHTVHLGERDCSIQRRHQKVIEESPSPAVSAELRDRMGASAVAAARTVGYMGAGTVEFLLAPSGDFYFLEMNTRLQVEHPVTEALTGLDLVEWQLRVAAGEALPLTQQEVRWTGHAIEVRLCAEDPHLDFLPCSGTVKAWREPVIAGVRVDHGLQSGQTVPSAYDSMLAKVIAHGATREEARRRLAAALQDLVVLGIPTNRAFLLAALRHPAFVSGAAHTGFIEKHFPKGSAAMQRPRPDAALLALGAALLFEAAAPASGSGSGPWRSAGSPTWPLRFEADGTPYTGVLTAQGPGRYTIRVADHAVELEIVERSGRSVRFAVQGHLRTAGVVLADGMLHLDLQGAAVDFRDTLRERTQGPEADGDARMLAPMNGRIVAVLAKAGERVTKGQRILVLEAMKMQHEIAAGRGGVIETIAVREGDQVATRQLLAALARDPA